MHKYAALMTVAMLTTGYAVVQLTNNPSDGGMSVPEMLVNDHKVREMVASYRCFKTVFQSTIESLRAGQVGLKEAHERVHEASSRHFPEYLKLLSISDQGSTVAERLARNLIGHVRSLEEFRESDPSPLPGLEVELEELLCEIAD